MEIHHDVSLARVRRRIEGDEFRIVEGHYPPGARLKRHAHRAANLTWVLRGAVHERWDADWMRCGPGTVLFKPAFQPHSNRYGPNGALVVHLEASRRGSPAARALASLFPAVPRCGHQTPEFLSDVLSAQDLARLMLRLSKALALEGGLRSAHPWLPRLRRRIVQRCDQPFRLRDIAEEFGVSRATLTRSFRARYGCSIGEYQRRARVERAAALLVSTRLPIERIALDCGFADQAHLCRLFRNRTGKSPGSYRCAYAESNLPSTPRAAPGLRRT